MRRNINKIVAFAIGISVMNANIMSVFAADNTQSQSGIAQSNTIKNASNTKVQTNKINILTLDGAIKSAISISDTLVLDSKKINYQNNTNDTNEELDNYNNVNGDQEDFNEDTRDITVKKLKQQKDFDEDMLIQKTTKAYNNIVTSQMKIDKAAKELEIKSKQLDDTKFKESLGMITSTDLKSTELETQYLKNIQKLSKNTLKDAEYSFKVLTGKDVTQYSLEQDIEYGTLKIDGSIDEYLDDIIDTYLKYSEQLVKLNKDYYKDSDRKVTEDDLETAKNTSDNVTKPTISSGETFDQYLNDYNKYESDKKAYTNAISARLVYLSNKLNIYKDETNLNENKKEFKEQLRTLYTNILTTEDNINYLKKNIELNNKKLSDEKFKYDLGMTTESYYNTQVINSEDLDIQLRNAIDSYNTLKEEIQKPWIAFS